MRSKNVLVSNPSSLLNIAHSGTGTIIFEFQHDSNINVAILGTGQFILSGRVRGNGRLSVSGTPRLDALACPMKIVTIEMSGTGLARVYGVEGVHITMSGVGTICYRGPLLGQITSGLGWISECILEQTSEKPLHSSSKSDKIMDRNQRLMVILAITVFFLFF
ncbi:unnamed protein product [Rotaria sp. Silwood1]|nr:unnamed protein product [Rotaria sp. Silwood1]